MPLHAFFNHELRRVTFIWIAPVSPENVEGALQRQAEEGAWGYAVLHDTRAVAPQPKRAEEIGDRVRTLSERYGPRGPVALVVRPESLSSAQRYAFGQNRRGHAMQVFWDRDEASAWLDDCNVPVAVERQSTAAE